MTAQSMEKLIFNGETLDIASEPLAPYLESLEEKPNLFSSSSACWRGYIGTWELVEDKLYLVDFEGSSANLSNNTYWEIGMDFLFPNHKKVFADWFSGEIDIPQGKPYYYTAGIPPTYEENIFLKFEKGYIVSKRTVDNHEKIAKRIEFHENWEKRNQQKKEKKSLFQRIFKGEKR